MSTGRDQGTLSVSEPQAEGQTDVDELERTGDEEPETSAQAEEAEDDGETAAEDTSGQEAAAAEETAALEAKEASETAEAEAQEAASGPGPGDQLSDEELLQGVTALVYASPDPLGTGRLVKLLERPKTARVKAALKALEEKLQSSGLPIELRQLAGGWQIVTQATMGEVVGRLFQERKTERISAAALETLAIVAYRQPVTKAEIEAIRGVQAGPILRNLVDRGLVRVTGRADQPGHPLQYGTTRSFLDRFGLGSLEDLPRDGELAGDA